jgi:hypothetical protein
MPFSTTSYVFPEITIEGPLERSYKEREAYEKAVADKPDRRIVLPGIDVLTLGTLAPEQAVRLFGSLTLLDRNHRLIKLPPRPIVCYLDYPLSKSARVTIPPYRRGGILDAPTKRNLCMYPDWILWALAHAYQAIYAHADTYGVWGHCIGDLCFEVLYIKGTKAYVGIGS